MLDAIKHGLGNLLNGAGRDARQPFWYYVLFLYALTIAISMAVSMPLMIESMVVGVRQGMDMANAHDPAAVEAATEAAMLTSMAESMKTAMWVSVGLSVILLFGLAASLVRRLHDSDLSGWWALIPGALQAVTIALAPQQIDQLDEMLKAQMTDPMAGFAGMGSPGTLAGWAAILAVIILGVRKSTPGPNRFGEAPFTA